MKRIALATTFTPTVKADRAAGVISGVAVITAGLEAHGHNAPAFVTDAVLLQQVAAAINAQSNGVRCRMGHAEVEGVDGLHVVVGKIRNARVDGGVVRADFHAGKGADKDDLDRLYWLAEDAPEDAGLSIVPADYEFIEEDGELHLRVASMFAVDWVGVPAANPAGMLSKKQGAKPGKAIAMKLNAAQIAFLKTAGLADGATEEDTQKFVDEMNPEMKAQFSAIKGDEEMPAVPAAAAVAAPVAASAAKPAPVALAAAPDAKATLTEINDIAKLASLSGDWAVEMFLSGKTPAEARKLALAAKAKATESGAPAVHSITVGDDQNRVSLREAIPDAIMLRASYAPTTPHARASELRGLSVLDMARHYFQSIGVRDAFMLSRPQIVRLISPREFRKKYPSLQSSSEFDSILADTINKTLRKAYDEQVTTWQKWCRKETAPDFKTVRRTQLHQLASLTTRTEGQGVNYVAMNDSGETYNLAEYHGGVSLTHKALVNDDLSAFSRVTRMLGEAAKRTEDDVAYAVLTGNAAMADGGNLFNDTALTTAGGHANFLDSGNAISVTSLAVGFNAMFVQTGGTLGTGASLEIVPKFLIVPSSKTWVAAQLINSAELLTSEALTSGGIMKGTKNPFNGSLEIIPSARLQASSADAWYLAADPNRIDTVEVCFLQGEEQPVLAQETDFDTDDVRYKVRHTVTAKAIDYRGMYRNDGA